MSSQELYDQYGEKRTLHFWVEGEWLSEFVRTVYWMEHRKIYALNVLNDTNLTGTQQLAVLLGDVTLTNLKDESHTLILKQKPDKKAQKKLAEQLKWLEETHIHLDNGRWVNKDLIEDYTKNEWRQRRQADFVERMARYSRLIPETIIRFKNIRRSLMNSMLEDAGVLQQTEKADSDETQRLLIQLIENDYRIKGLKPFPYSEYECPIDEAILNQIDEINEELDSIYIREFEDVKKLREKLERGEKVDESVAEVVEEIPSKVIGPDSRKLLPLELKDKYYPVPIQQGNWKIVEEVEDEVSGWVDPKGNWWNVPFAEHQMFADWVVYHQYSAYSGYCHYNNHRSGDVLVQMGWLLIHTDIMSGTSINGEMNIDQYVTLTKAFGTRPLFRGWTVRALWRDSPNYREG